MEQILSDVKLGSTKQHTNILSMLRRIPILLLVGDIFGLLLCVEVTLWLTLRTSINVLNPILIGSILLVVMGMYFANAYNPESQIAGLRAPARIVICNLVVAAMIAALIYLSGTWKQNALLAKNLWLPSLGLFTVWAIATRMKAVEWMRSHTEQTHWLILGAGDNTIKFVETFLQKNPFGKLVILVEDKKKGIGKQTIPLLEDNRLHINNLSELHLWSKQPWSGVIVGSEIRLSDDLVKNVMEVRLQGSPVYRLPEFCEASWYKLPSSFLQDTWFAFSQGFNLVNSPLQLKLKKFVDKLTAGILLLLLSPLMLLVALLIKLDSPGPVFYSQSRTGINCQPFKVHKFRSMYQDAEKRGAQWASERDPRITRVGYWIRILRIDELPQIWNVLKGEMSLIGPRPERPEFDVKLKKEIPYYDVRYLVKPGITGWAQVMYPYGASVEDAYEKLSYDLYYIKNYSLLLDIAIFFKTIRVVLLGKGR